MITTGPDVVIGRGVLIIGLVSVIFAIMIGYATVHAERNDRCGEIGAQVIQLGGGKPMTAEQFRSLPVAEQQELIAYVRQHLDQGVGP